jgi:hypothetical protein
MKRKRNTLTRTCDGHRIALWPIYFLWGARSSGAWFTRHFWETHSEQTPDGSTAGGTMPGLRKVFGQTIHFGRLKLCAGRRTRDMGCVPQHPGDSP